VLEPISFEGWLDLVEAWAARKPEAVKEVDRVGFASGCAITMIAKTALERARIRGYAHQGAHIFRHSLATELLRSGATLSEIGQLLRHEGHDTTRIYAKVDVDALRTLSPPWPGGVQ
jgi:integrase